MPRSRNRQPLRIRLDAARLSAQNPSMLIYKVLRHDEFRQFTLSGQTAGAPIDLADGYIHLSTAAQLAETLAKHFAGEQGLHVLALDSEALADLRWEPSRGGDLFPHLYRDLRQNDLRWSRPLPLGPDGHDLTGIL